MSSDLRVLGNDQRGSPLTPALSPLGRGRPRVGSAELSPLRTGVHRPLLPPGEKVPEGRMRGRSPGEKVPEGRMRGRRARSARNGSLVAIGLLISACATPPGATRGGDPPASDSPMVKLLKSGRVPEARQGTILEMIGKRGTVGDLDYIYQQALEGRF